MNNINELKGLLERLNSGESLDAVKKDFAEKFSSVSAQEILDAEQQLIKEGTPAAQVKKLCDVHSALFHTSCNHSIEAVDFDSLEKGHPAQILHLENVALEKFLDELKTFDAEKSVRELPKLFGLYTHYAKKEQLFMSVLSQHGVTGPSQVMWAVDDEIRKDLRGLVKKLSPENFSEHEKELAAFLQRVREMIFKEEKIFLPLSLKTFTQDDWLAIYADSSEYGFAFIDKAPIWAAGEEFLESQAVDAEKISDEEISFDTGALTFAQLKGIFKLLPIDITFIDADDTITFFVNNGKVFARPKSALGQKVFEYHPPEILPMVRAMLDDFKAKKRDRAEFFRNIKGKPTSVVYRAVYDGEDYLGAVEFVQDFSDALKKFS